MQNIYIVGVGMTPFTRHPALSVKQLTAWAEQAALRDAGCTLVHLGPRVLRLETACVAATAILKARLGWLGAP